MHVPKKDILGKPGQLLFRRSVQNFKMAAGCWHQRKVKPIIDSHSGAIKVQLTNSSVKAQKCLIWSPLFSFTRQIWFALQYFSRINCTVTLDCLIFQLSFLNLCNRFSNETYFYGDAAFLTFTQLLLREVFLSWPRKYFLRDKCVINVLSCRIEIGFFRF